MAHLENIKGKKAFLADIYNFIDLKLKALNC
jgi:hypothetical protein